jgi:ABC-2 type transport system ATP-binding protein
MGTRIISKGGRDMNEIILYTNHLCKYYKETQALNNVSISLKRGRIYGLIGQNGAGKTTLMRIISGLTRQTSGEFELFGKTEEKDIRDARKKIGCMIEYPSLVGSMTAKENIHLHRILKGIPNAEKESELLKAVGLEDTGKKKVKDFSLGMKQRLGIANTMICNPEFLILDEPINGLDPIGVVEIRHLLKKLCEEHNITILISSHNLPELYQLATDYIIVHKGCIKETITLQELEEKCRQHLAIKCNNTGGLVTVLEQKLHTDKFRVLEDGTVQLFEYLDDKLRVSQILYENGIVVSELTLKGESLENYFINVVGGAK